MLKITSLPALLRQVFILVFLLHFILNPPPPAAPVVFTTLPPLELEGMTLIQPPAPPAPPSLPLSVFLAPDDEESALFIWNQRSGQVAASWRAEEKMAPASLTKLMTALVAWEKMPREKKIVVEDFNPWGSQMGLQKGEIISVEGLLWGLLLNSGNDAASVLAANFPGGTKAFVAAMNRKAAELGLKQTHFTNPVGWDDPAHYSTARDLAYLTHYFLQEPFLAQIVTWKTKTWVGEQISSSAQGEKKKITHYLQNTNPLLGLDPTVAGVKTGFTEQAGQCLIFFRRGKKQQWIVVLLHSRDRKAEGEKILRALAALE